MAEQMLPVLSEIAADDKSGKVRAEAANVLGALHRHAEFVAPLLFWPP